MDFDFGPMMDDHIARSTVGFISIDSGVPKPMGSGTLVKCQSVQGILTCAHVLEEIERQIKIGFGLFPVRSTQRQSFILETSIFIPNTIKIYVKPPTENGPDLAFIPLPESTMSSLLAIGSVVDLDIEKERAASPMPSAAESLEAVAGIVGVMTPPANTVDGKQVLNVEGLINVGKVIETDTTNQYDLLTFEPQPEVGFQLPHCYGGMSGGGIWRLCVEKQLDQSYVFVERRLVGVVYWQTSPPNRKIIGHGPISLYEHLLSEIHKRWS